MYCYFSASRSNPPILLTSLYPLHILLKKLCELSLSGTPVFFFVIDRCWLNFILHVLLFFSQLQPPPILLIALSTKRILLRLLCESCLPETPVFFFFWYWQMLIKFYIACTAIFQPVAATPQSCWRLCTRFAFFWKSYVSYPRLRLKFVCFFLLLTDVD